MPTAAVTNGEVVIAGTDTYQVLLNDSRIRLEMRGDFTLSATIEAGPKDQAGIQLWSTVPPGQGAAEWYANAKRLMVGLASAHVQLLVFDGTGSKPAYQFYSKDAAPAGPVALQVRKAADAIVLSVNGAEAARTNELGPLGEGLLYLGAALSANGQLTIRELSVTQPAGSPPVQVVQSPLLAGVPLPTQASSLRSLAAPRGRLVGAGAILARQFRWNQPYRETTAREFNSLADATSFDWKATEPGRDTYRFCDADQIVNFASANGMRVDGKFLTYGNQDPEWLTNGRFSRAELLDIMHAHIQTLVSRYRGRIAVWEVANEVLDYDYQLAQSGRLRDTVWARGIGPDYLDMAFRWAHDADPQAVLVLNETGAEGMDAKSNAFYELVKGLRARGVLITAVGMQMHWWKRGAGGDAGAPAPAAVAQNMKRLADLGLDVYVTEMDVPVADPPTATELAAQAQTYRDMLAVCLAAANCKGLTTWGVYDGDTWLADGKDYHKGLAAPLLFDASFRPKPAYQAMVELLAGR